MAGLPCWTNLEWWGSTKRFQQNTSGVLNSRTSFLGTTFKSFFGLTRANRFAIVQPTLRGGEPSENEIHDVLQQAGWRRVPIDLQSLPAQLMGSAWWHEEEGLVLLDARKPNFKKTEFGVLPIDLILGDLSLEMRARIVQASP